MSQNRSFPKDEIIKAVESGDAARLEEIANPEDVLVRDIVKCTMIPAKGEATTPFITAAARGHYFVVHYLLWMAKRFDAGNVDLNVLDADGMSALMHAAVGGHEAVVKILLKNGCDPRNKFYNPQTQSLESAAELARKANHHHLAEELALAEAAKNAAPAAVLARKKFALYSEKTSQNDGKESQTKKARVKFSNGKK